MTSEHEKNPLKDDDLAFESVAEQARLIERREISPVDLVRLYLQRIERWDQALRAYITVCGEQALALARDAEREIGAGRYRGPLHGIPYGVKDQLCTRGIRTTVGARIQVEGLDFDATVIERLNAAGAILLGKQNLSEFGKGGNVTFPYGQPRNPWGLEHTPMTSSSGPGIASAAGLCSGSLGEDTGGSIVGPAAANGIVGLRPTYGRVSRYGGVMYGWTNDAIGPMTRTVEDCALFLQTIAGHDPKDALTSTRPVPDYTKSLTGDLKGLRLAVVAEMTWTDDIHPEVRDAMQTAIDVLKSLGAKVAEVSLPLVKHVIPLRMLTTDADVAAVFLEKWLRTRWHDFDIATRTRFAAASIIPASVYGRAMRARTIVRRHILDALQRYDALLSPTDLNPPARISDSHEKVDTPAMAKKVFLARVSTGPFALANMPALALPNGFSSTGLPISLQIGGRPFAEEMVFRVAHAFEQATSWHTRHPDLERTVGEYRQNAATAGDQTWN